MQESPKEETGKKRDREQKSESGDSPCWAEEFDYYYDDAHGYETYDPDADEEDEDAEAAGEDLK
jgi:hypothetical protein